MQFDDLMINLLKMAKMGTFQSTTKVKLNRWENLPDLDG